MKVERCDGKVFEFDGCFGCACAPGGALPAYPYIIWEDETFFVEQDFELPINGFIIIATKRCVGSINELNDTEKQKLILLIDRIIVALKKIGVAKEFNIIQEEKEGYHFHFWIMPSSDWAKQKFGKILKNVKQIQDYAKENFKDEEHLKEIRETCEKLKEELKNF